MTACGKGKCGFRPVHRLVALKVTTVHETGPEPRWMPWPRVKTMQARCLEKLSVVLNESLATRKQDKSLYAVLPILQCDPKGVIKRQSRGVEYAWS